MFIGGLNPGIHSLVSSYGETERRIGRSRREGIQFLDIAHYAQNEGDTLRARFGRRRNADHGGKRQVSVLKPLTRPVPTHAAPHRMMMTEYSAYS